MEGVAYIGDSPRGIGESALDLGQLIARTVGRHDRGVREPLICRVLDLGAHGGFEKVDNALFGRVDVLLAVAVGRAIVADVKGGEAGLAISGPFYSIHALSVNREEERWTYSVLGELMLPEIPVGVLIALPTGIHERQQVVFAKRL